MSETIGLLVGFGGIALFVFGAFLIHPGLGWIAVGICVMGIGKAILE